MTSALTLYQVVAIIAGLASKNLKDHDMINWVLDSIESLPSLRIILLTLEDLTQAASLVIEYSLYYEDALHLATALRNNAKEIVFCDRDFEKTPRNPWKKYGLRGELVLVGEYGLSNKRELWRAASILRKYRNIARSLFVLTGEERRVREKALIDRLCVMGLVPKDADANYVLQLSVKDVRDKYTHMFFD